MLSPTRIRDRLIAAGHSVDGVSVDNTADPPIVQITMTPNAPPAARSAALAYFASLDLAALKPPAARDFATELDGLKSALIQKGTLDSATIAALEGSIRA